MRAITFSAAAISDNCLIFGLFSRFRAALAAALLGLVAACGGGGGGDSPHEDPAAAVRATNLAVIGNSITWHPPLASIGWAGDWGMAATTQAQDFVHVAGAALGLPVQANNFADLELTPVAATPRIPDYSAPVSSTSIAVVQLADNVPPGGLDAFRPAYAQLLDAVKHARTLLCVSTWWHSPEKDAVIETECRARGGRFVFIGDIKTLPENPDRVSTRYWHPGVNSHPQDWSMAEIGRRVAAAAR
jgi:hypothetical protein